MDGGRFLAGGPTGRDGQALTPGQAAVGASFVLNRALAVAFGVDTENGPSVLQKNRGGMTQILTRLAVHHDLAGGLRREVDEGDRIAAWRGWLVCIRADGKHGQVHS